MAEMRRDKPARHRIEVPAAVDDRAELFDAAVENAQQEAVARMEQAEDRVVALGDFGGAKLRDAVDDAARPRQIGRRQVSRFRGDVERADDNPPRVGL